MKKLILALSIIFSLEGFSQITITSADMPAQGDTLRISNALVDATVLANYQRGGANQTWNFDTLRPTSQTVREFVSSSSTPYNQVPTNRIGILFADTLSLGPNSVNDVYNFANSTATDFSVDYRAASIPIGLPFLPVFIMQNSYTDKDEIFQFPLDYQDRDSSTFNFVFNNVFPPIYYRSSGYRVNEVDGWGSITTPYGTFDALRVVTNTVSLDSISFNGQNIAIPSHLREYQWIANGVGIPVMKVFGLVTAGLFVPTSVEYRDSARVIEPLLPTTAIFRADSTTIEVEEDLGFTNLSIGSTSFQWDFTPNTVNYKVGSSTSRNITVSFQDTGLYSVRLIASGGSSSDTLERLDYIRVTPSSKVVSFKLEGDTTFTNEDFTIKNTSGFGNSFNWEITPSTFVQNGVTKPAYEFKNGTNNQSGDSIVLRFAKVGFFSVRLNATEGSELKFEAKSNAVFVRFPVGIQESTQDHNKLLTLSPNPAAKGGEVTIQATTLTFDLIEVIDIEGKLMYQHNAQNVSNYSFNLPEVSGMYFVKILTNKGLITKKIVVE